jgi:hypothetical protein
MEATQVAGYQASNALNRLGCPEVIDFMERETGIEPATNSLEGCDSTTELLPLDSPYSNTPVLAGESCRDGSVARNSMLDACAIG